MYFEENFITEKDAFKYCMAESVYAFKDYEAVMKRISAKPSFVNYINAMPAAIANSIAERAITPKHSILKGHFLRDIARNIAESEVLRKATECVENDVPMQIAFDKKGNPIGDSAEIVRGVITGLECVQRSFGELSCVEVEPSKIELHEMGNRSVTISPENGVVHMNRAKVKEMETTQAQ